MNVSHFDLTNDLKCSTLSPANCTVIEKRNFWSEIPQSHQGLLFFRLLLGMQK